MSEATATASGGASAGRLLRQAREAQGMHLAALAGAIKVAPNKLEALEADRYDQLLDATFARALAQTVCRTLKIDAAPVLALLPKPGANRLGETGQNLNAPFYEAQGPASGGDYSGLARPAVWGPLLLLVIAAAVYLMPHDWLASIEARRAAPRDQSDPAVGSAGVPRVGTVVETVQPAAMPDPAASASATASTDNVTAASPSAATQSPTPAATPVASADTTPSASAAAAPKLLQVQVRAQSWIGVTDVRGQSLIARTVQPGENVELDGPVPLKVTVGNAAATSIVFRGQALELAPFTRGNLARFELK